MRRNAILIIFFAIVVLIIIVRSVSFENHHAEPESESASTTSATVVTLDMKRYIEARMRRSRPNSFTSTAPPTTTKPKVARSAVIMVASTAASAASAATRNNSGWKFRNATFVSSVLNKIEYCRYRDGECDFILGGDECTPPGLHPAFGKIQLLLSVLDRYEWVLVVDADAFITNYDISIETILTAALGGAVFGAEENAHSKDFVVSRDWAGISTGVFAVRRSEWAKEFFSRVISPPRECRYFEGLQHYEQSVVKCLLDESVVGFGAQVDSWKIQVVPHQRLLQSYPPPFDFEQSESRFRAGDFIAHFAGASVLSDYKFPNYKIDDAIATVLRLCAHATPMKRSDDDWRTMLLSSPLARQVQQRRSGIWNDRDEFVARKFC